MNDAGAGKKPGSWVSASKGGARPTAGRSGQVFGVPLDALLARDQQRRPYLKVPLFVYKAIKYLTVHGLDKPGILRHAGSGPEVQRYQQLIDGGTSVKLKGVEDVNTVSSLLKNFLRQLPDPLLTSALYQEWVGLPELRDVVQCVQKVNELVHRLPSAHRAVLSELIRLLYQIDQASEMSKMDAGSLASLMAKNLLWKDGESEEALETTVKLNDIVKMMILEYPLLFESEEAEHVSSKPELAQYARFLRKLVGHKKSVSCVESTWDGKHMWSGDSEGQIRLWNVDDLKQVGGFEASTTTIFAIKRVQNNMWCASGESLQIRDQNGKLLHEFPGRTFCVLQVDPTSVWTACEGKIRIWDIRRMECKKEIPVAPVVLSLAFDGVNVWGGCNDKKLRIWNVKTLAVEKEIEGHSRKINHVLFAERYIWSSGDDKVVCLWDPNTFERVRKLEDHTGYVYGLTGMGDTVWSCSWDKSIRLWDKEGGVVGRLLSYHSDGVSTVGAVYSPRRRGWLAWSASFDRSVTVWLVTPAGCSLPIPQTQGQHVVESLRPDGIFQADASVAPNESMMGMGVSMVSTSMRDYSFDPAKRDPTGLLRWEIDPALIKNPGNSLGTGSFGTVFKAELHGKEVAVKKLSTQKFDDKTLEEFRKEVAIMSTLRHPNVLLFMGACTQPGNLLIVTELMPRGSVYDLLRDPKVALTFRRKMQFAKDAALGVNWLHRSKPQFLHLDLKAANLLVDSNWTVKVADFGLSVVKQDAAAKKERHGPIGTPLWMAPEVLMNKPYDEKADVYSFAIVLWEILSAADPWQEIESLVELVDAVCLEHKRPALPKDVVPSLRDLINACWLPAPDSRPSFEEIVPRFDVIIIDGLISDPLGRKFWSDNFLGKQNVPFQDFVVAFVPFMKLPAPSGPTDIKYQCLRQVVAQGAEKEKVSMEGFSKMLSWFGPLSETGLLDRIYELLKKPFFHGEISSTEAEKLIAPEKKGTFLLRFSNRDAGCYALTVQGTKGGLKHYRIQHTPGGRYAIGKVECSSLDALIKKYHTELNLKRPCPGSKYEAMFHAFEKNVAALGYQEVNL